MPDFFVTIIITMFHSCVCGRVFPSPRPPAVHYKWGRLAPAARLRITQPCDARWMGSTWRKLSHLLRLLLSLYPAADSLCYKVSRRSFSGNTGVRWETVRLRWRWTAHAQVTTSAAAPVELMKADFTVFSLDCRN